MFSTDLTTETRYIYEKVHGERGIREEHTKSNIVLDIGSLLFRSRIIPSCILHLSFYEIGRVSQSIADKEV